MNWKNCSFRQYGGSRSHPEGNRFLIDSLNSFALKSNQKFKIRFERESYTGEEQLGIYIRVETPESKTLESRVIFCMKIFRRI